MARRLIALLIVSAMAISLTACSNAQSGSFVQENVKSELKHLINGDEVFTERDMRTSYEKPQSTEITLKDNSSRCVSKAVTIDGNKITIGKEGIYVLSGSLSDGQIIVDSTSSDKIQLVLNGVSISCKSSAPIYVKQANKVFVTTLENTDNTLATTDKFKVDGNTKVDGVIFSKDDITLCGLGTLNINSTAHGIVSKDELKIGYGTYNVQAKKHALSGSDCVAIAEGTLNLNAKKDAIHSANKENDEKGYVYIKSGNINAECQSDGIDAQYALQIDGGSIRINASGDGAKCDSDLQINGGTVNISNSDEGIEGKTVEINSGNISIKSKDDGINASGSNTKSSNPMDIDESAVLTINGGELEIDAGGDGVDSNGAIYINGGSTLVSGAANGGDAAIDYASKGVITGGSVVATGMSNMAVGFSEDSTQCSMLVTLASICKEKVTLKDSSSKELISYTPAKEYNCVIISTPDIKQGDQYTLIAGSESQEIKMDSMTYGDSHEMGKPYGGNGMAPPDGNAPPFGNEPPKGSNPPDANGFEEGKEPPDMKDLPEGFNPPEGFKPPEGEMPPDGNIQKPDNTQQ